MPKFAVINDRLFAGASYHRIAEAIVVKSVRGYLLLPRILDIRI